MNIPGLTVIPGTPDPAFPNALPVLGFIETSFVNQDKQEVSGVDFGANLTLPIGDTVTPAQRTRRIVPAKYELTTDAGDVLRYDGTLSPCNITSCSGSPKWRASWQNTVEFGKATVSLTGLLHQRLRHGLDRLRRRQGRLPGQRGRRGVDRGVCRRYAGALQCQADLERGSHGALQVQRQVHRLRRRTERVRHRATVRTVGGLRPVLVQPGMGRAEHHGPLLPSRREDRFLTNQCCVEAWAAPSGAARFFPGFRSQRSRVFRRRMRAQAECAQLPPHEKSKRDDSGCEFSRPPPPPHIRATGRG